MSPIALFGLGLVLADDADDVGVLGQRIRTIFPMESVSFLISASMGRIVIDITNNCVSRIKNEINR